ncbi:MAG: hypothetical protein HC894_29695 [Microcoleus sp. SM1_3_4]|nr:hypothetical protein [Microcoleus sp. SM1_3_4]
MSAKTLVLPSQMLSCALFTARSQAVRSPVKARVDLDRIASQAKPLLESEAVCY